MTHVHDTHHGHSSTTVVERDAEGPAMALIVVAVLVALVVMIWFFAFSGIVFDRGDSGPNTNIEQQIENNPPQDNTAPDGGVPQPTGTGG